MKLAQIIKLALRQLDEDLEDAADYDELFKMYANQGHVIAYEDFYKPREYRTYESDEFGRIEKMPTDGKVLGLWDENKQSVFYDLTPDGKYMITGRPEAEFSAYVELTAPELIHGDDEPGFPEKAHSGLVDYICYRHLISGNMAKQQRAQIFYNEFLRAMHRITPQGDGSVTRMRNVYVASDIRNNRR